MAESRPFRVLIVDDHHMVRAGLRQFLESDPEVLVVAEASSGTEAVKLSIEHRPEILLLDIRLPDISGIEVTEKVLSSFPETKIIVISSYDGDRDVLRALDAGALAYLLKDALPDELLRAIRRVSLGKRYIATSVASTLAENHPRCDLSRREIEVLTYVGKGLRNREIARLLGTTEGTVKTYLKRIAAKLDVTDRTEAVTVGLRRGFIHLE